MVGEFIFYGDIIPRSKEILEIYTVFKCTELLEEAVSNLQKVQPGIIKMSMLLFPFIFSTLISPYKQTNKHVWIVVNSFEKRNQ